ncbi:uncharacterized protein LAESUDRAFT_286972 [Laetiporus sulphureus 93-53]|uniref:Uncharacterized protein n=1 Tax=Laetiporus sulphureus 93-53 TaxID=1314785 RepID=A0A165DCQ8_9APHY|nr:uncharacterized protein LAESUDRAFT_286972 [Laetiporus sulphureus 93-53]KZT04574.1 hypothetical protein LAESUDRAFT_286972 [Laetiporus sulphureus 93-53]
MSAQVLIVGTLFPRSECTVLPPVRTDCRADGPRTPNDPAIASLHALSMSTRLHYFRMKLKDPGPLFPATSDS